MLTRLSFIKVLMGLYGMSILGATFLHVLLWPVAPCIPPLSKQRIIPWLCCDFVRLQQSWRLVCKTLAFQAPAPGCSCCMLANIIDCCTEMNLSITQLEHWIWLCLFLF